MALIKTFTNGSGFTGNYWKLMDLDTKKTTGTIEALVVCYIDKAARLANMKPFAQKTFTIKLSDIDLKKDIYEEVYKKLPTLKTKTGFAAVNEKPFFEDAEVDN